LSIFSYIKTHSAWTLNNRMFNEKNVSVSAVRLIELSCHSEGGGHLVVMEGSTHIPFCIARVFVVSAPAGTIRGRHAHKACSQFLICQTGSVEVLCTDGVDSATYALDRPDLGLLIPSGIWAQQTYLLDNSVLTVLCDQPYEAQDYIRDYAQFKVYRAVGATRT